ncbi:MAG: hypothetical protein KI785_00115 [Devosiaceae bacterium]|nr:hypothetical protein [Devosiaceae bacterium MH13]
MVLLAQQEGWEVWISWYEARLRGGLTYPQLSPAANARIDNAQALEIMEEDWDQGPAHVNAKIRAIIERETLQDQRERTAQESSETSSAKQPAGVDIPDTLGAVLTSAAARAQLKSVVGATSPTVVQGPAGALDAVPNPHTDFGDGSVDLRELPERQCSIIGSILSDYPQNAPKHVRTSLEYYAAHLQERGTRPSVGLLDDHAIIVVAATGSPQAQVWMEAGQVAAFGLFRTNHGTIKTHFPLSAARDQAFGAIEIDEDAVDDTRVRPIKKQLDEGVHQAHEAGAVTDGFKQVSDQLAAQLTTATDLDPNDLRPSWDDRFGPSPKKRALLASAGFYYSAFNHATVATSEPLQALASVLAAALRELFKLIGWLA